MDDDDAIVSFLRTLYERNVDFWSVCQTATVPRADLTLVLVRANDAARTTTAVLFNVQDSCSSLHATVRRIHPETLRVVDAKRRRAVSASDKTSVFEAMSSADGTLAASVRTMGSVFAYRRNTTQKTLLCMHTALAFARVARQKKMTDGSAKIVDAIQRLTNRGHPTPLTIDDCQCSQSAECACFMYRAMFRAGRTCLLVHAIVTENDDDDDSSSSSMSLARSRAEDVRLVRYNRAFGYATPIRWTFDRQTLVAFVDCLGPNLQTMATEHTSMDDLLNDDADGDTKTKNESTLSEQCVAWARLMLPSFGDVIECVAQAIENRQHAVTMRSHASKVLSMANLCEQAARRLDRQIDVFCAVRMYESPLACVDYVLSSVHGENPRRLAMYGVAVVAVVCAGFACHKNGGIARRVLTIDDFCS